MAPKTPRVPIPRGAQHQGPVDEAHLQSYLDEFVFRINRRTSRSAARSSTGFSSSPPQAHGAPTGRAGWGRPPTLDRPPANRPWRAA